jgi:hypothetical protein
MSRYDHKIENCLEGIDHLSKQKKEVKKTSMVNSLWSKINSRKSLDSLTVNILKERQILYQMSSPCKR